MDEVWGYHHIGIDGVSYTDEMWGQFNITIRDRFVGVYSGAPAPRRPAVDLRWRYGDGLGDKGLHSFWEIFGVPGLQHDLESFENNVGLWRQW